MREKLPERLERGRIKTGYFASPSGSLYGAFFVQGPCGAEMKIIAAAGDEPESEGWEHVSVSIERRPPNWQEMCFVKALFWEAEECVMQLHPPESAYINNHPYCLHLWHPTKQKIPLPPSILVGVKNIGTFAVSTRAPPERRGDLA